MITIAFRAAGETVARIDDRAHALGIDRSEAIRSAVHEWLDRPTAQSVLTDALIPDGEPLTAETVKAEIRRIASGQNDAPVAAMLAGALAAEAGASVRLDGGTQVLRPEANDA